MDKQIIDIDDILQKLIDPKQGKGSKNQVLAENEIRAICMKSREIFLQ